MDILQGKIIFQKEKEAITAEAALKKKILILYYFTSNKCEACRMFDEKLRQIYEEAVLRKVELAVIVISTDNDEENFKENIKRNDIQWFHIKFGDDLIQYLVYNYGVTHIPSLVVVRKNGTIVTREGVNDINKIGINVLVTWSE